MRDEGWVRCPDCENFVLVPGEERLGTPLFVATCASCGLEFDWRLSYGSEFLRRAKLRWERYQAPDDVWDHDHCALCWQRFMEDDSPSVEHAGFVTYIPDQLWWICRRCFDDLHEEMGWRVEPNDS